MTQTPIEIDLISSGSELATNPEIVEGFSNPDVAGRAEHILYLRNIKLKESDWTQIEDALLTEEELQAWNEYRQALWEISEQEGFPFEVSWPAEP